MATIDWPRLFSRYEVKDTRSGLNPDYIPLVDQFIGEALSIVENEEIESRGTSHPKNWAMPSRPLPQAGTSWAIAC